MFKNYIAQLVLFLFVITATAQSKEEQSLQQQFWQEGTPASKTLEIPEKWKNESAVILYLSEYYGFTNNGKKMYNPSSIHQRVKLQDKAAVEYFSEFEYKKDQKIGFGLVNFSREKTTIGIKIIKQDGTENILNISEESILQDDTNKLAIPGLEVGDVLDIFIYEDDYLKAFSGYHEYDPQEKVLSTVYPVSYRKLSVEVENDYFLNMESFNGAPKIKEEKTDRRATRKYVLEATDIETIEFPRWYYPLTELHAIKFQVVFALKNSNEARANVFLSEKDAVRKGSVSKEEILDYYGGRFDTDSRRDVKDVLKYLEKKGITNKREQMEQALYYIRHKSYNRFVELVLASDKGISNYPMLCDKDYVVLNENRFVNYMSGLAKQLEIDYDIIVATPEYEGSIDDLLIRKNVAHGLRFNFPKPLYFFDLSPHVQPDYFPKYLEGTKVFKLNVKKNRKIDDVLYDTLPVTTAAENATVVQNNITLSADFKSMELERNSQFTGHFKTEALNTYLFFSDYINEEFAHYDTKHFYACSKKQNKSNTEIQNKIEALYATYREEHEKNLKESVDSELDAILDAYEYTVIDTARYSDAPLSVKEKFTIKGEFVKKAGPNFLVEVGKFISGQVQIQEAEIDRTLGVYVNNAKTYSYNTTITIPQGYTVVGLEKLNKNVSNETGSFVSAAIIENGVLKYTTKKTYAKRKYAAQEWKQMLPWLQAAYNFSQEKVMFKKEQQ
ncbi:hypothetical protein [Patiriisocius sp. Uisw_017]|uniref:hypothetical protein n=1 Tax=Patiriisocius sp. Uisw_017 TaxID=3230968 RepID=UPI0039E98CFF